MRPFCLSIVIACFLAGGCARLNTAIPRNYKTVEASSLGNTDAARKKHESALKMLANCDYEATEQCLHESLIEDVNFGPSHNTLGKLYFDQKKFYLAAWEFEYAIKTMPNRPEPLNNLGLVLEAVGQVEGAITNYQMAMQQDPDSPDYLGNYIRARYRQAGFTEDLRPYLETLIVLDCKPTWVKWAKLILAKNHLQTGSGHNSIGSFAPDDSVLVPSYDNPRPMLNEPLQMDAGLDSPASATPILNAPAPAIRQPN